MKFFVPGKNDQEAEQFFADMVKIYKLAQFRQSPRIFKIDFTHDEKRYSVQVGEPAPQYYGGGLVVAILRDPTIHVFLAIVYRHSGRDSFGIGEEVDAVEVFES